MSSEATGDKPLVSGSEDKPKANTNIPKAVPLSDDVLGTSRDKDAIRKIPISAVEVVTIFRKLDRQGNGEISIAEFISGLKASPDSAEKFGMPEEIRKESDARDTYELAFGKLDVQISKSVSVSILRGLEPHGPIGTDAIAARGEVLATARRR
jgi:hypothetical protein